MRKGREREKKKGGREGKKRIEEGRRQPENELKPALTAGRLSSFLVPLLSSYQAWSKKRGREISSRSVLEIHSSFILQIFLLLFLFLGIQ